MDIPETPRYKLDVLGHARVNEGRLRTPRLCSSMDSACPDVPPDLVTINEGVSSYSQNVFNTLAIAGPVATNGNSKIYPSPANGGFKAWGILCPSSDTDSTRYPTRSHIPVQAMTGIQNVEEVCKNYSIKNLTGQYNSNLQMSPPTNQYWAIGLQANGQILFAKQSDTTRLINDLANTQNNWDNTMNQAGVR